MWTKEQFIAEAQKHPHLDSLSKKEIKEKAEKYLGDYDWSNCPDLKYEVTRAVEDGAFDKK